VHAEPARHELVLVAAASLVVAASRLLAAAKSVWDWDEALFCSALRQYNVSVHHPHPPGYPLYIIAAHAARIFTGSEFAALRAVVLVAGMFVFPAAYCLARALRCDGPTSFLAALLFAFLPNVWFLSGTAFSDVPSLVLLLFALAALWRASPREASRGTWSRRAYFIGAILLGLALSFRPQNALIAFGPLVAASWTRVRHGGRRSDPLVAFLIIAAIAGIAYGGAAWVTGFDEYRRVLRLHSAYVLNVDGYRNPTRIPSLRLAWRYLFQPFGGRLLIVVWALAAVGACRAPRLAARVALTFVPFVVAACFLLNPDSISRYSIVYLFMPAVLAARGVRVRAVSVRRRAPLFYAALPYAVILTIVTRYIVWTLPALREVSTHDSPPVRAMQWIRRHPGPAYVDLSLNPFAELLLERREWSPLPPLEGRRAGHVAFEGMSTSAHAVTFLRDDAPFKGIARAYFFAASIVPASEHAEFGEGWYEPETYCGEVWRWMGRSSITHLPPLAGQGELTLRAGLPLEGRRHPVITVTFNGRVIDRFTGSARIERHYLLPSETPNELRLDLDRIVNPAREHLGDDARDLGLRLQALGWVATAPPPSPEY